MAWDTASTPNKLFRRSRWQLTVWYTSVMTVVLGLSGLGVYEAIAQAHGGDIQVQSQPGKGSAFTITLPTSA